MKRSSFGIERRLARTNKHALYVADFIGLDETELLLLIPWVDDPAFCRHTAVCSVVGLHRTHVVQANITANRNTGISANE
jgi:hypothetical protein